MLITEEAFLKNKFMALSMSVELRRGDVGAKLQNF